MEPGEPLPLDEVGELEVDVEVDDELGVDDGSESAAAPRAVGI